MRDLFASRRFLTALVDVLVATATLLIGRYAGEDTAFLLQLIVVSPPLFIPIIAAFTIDDVQAESHAHAERMETLRATTLEAALKAAQKNA